MRAFLQYLAINKHVAARTLNQALNALAFPQHARQALLAYRGVVWARFCKVKILGTGVTLTSRECVTAKLQACGNDG